MGNYNLANMPKLESYVKKERENGYDISIVRKGPQGRVGYCDLNGRIELNNYYVSGLADRFDENRMIGVLYHEIGHSKFRKMRITAGMLTPDHIEAEFQAFTYSLNKCKEIAEVSDSMPLESVIYWINERMNNLQDEPIAHRVALERLRVTDLWREHNP